MSPAVSNGSAPVNAFIATSNGSQPTTFKILKRPTSLQQESVKYSNDRQKMPLKPLEQREMEYAQARLRILGPDSVGGAANERRERPARFPLAHRNNASTRISSTPDDSRF